MMLFRAESWLMKYHRWTLSRATPLLFMMFSLLLLVPVDGYCDERVDRIEKMLRALEQKVEILTKENEDLRERVKTITATEQPKMAGIELAKTGVAAATVADKVGVATDKVEAPAQLQKQVSVDALKQETEKINDRLDEIESNNEEVDFKLNNLVNVDGYSSVEYYFTDQPGQNSKFRVRHFSLFFSKGIQDDWDLFSEVEFEDAPFIEAIHANPNNNGTMTVQGKFLVEQMYIKYKPEIDWDLVAGRFLTPAGIWNVYHYYPYVPTQERPFMVRVLFPQYSDGLQLRKSFNISDSLLDTHLYIANGGGNPGRLDRNVSKAVGGKLNLLVDFPIETQFGASIYREKDNLNVTRSTYGLHMMLDYDQFALQGEFALRKNAPLNALNFNDTSAYVQLSYDLDKWTLAARYDWFNSNSLIPLSDRFRYTGAVNYHFAHNVVGKVEYNRNKFDDPAVGDFHEVIMAISVAIGDL